MSFINYLMQNYGTVLGYLVEHIQLTLLAVAIAIVIGIPLGVMVYATTRVDKVILGGVNLIQAIPSMALLGAVIPLLGIGKVPAIIVVALYSLLPIVKNTFTGISSTPKETFEAARGIGLTKWQVLFKVQMPIALPVIMAGVRISAVTAVGLITIAAYIGAGGLGFLVFSGISTVNSNLILAGAIPACILALTIDYLGALVEKRISSRRVAKAKEGRRVLGMPVRGAALAAVALLCLGGYFAGAHLNADGRDSITVGGKDFTEQYILAHLYSELIEGNSDLKVNRKPNLGGTRVCLSALEAGDIDMYIEYSGTAYGDVLGLPPNTDMEEVYDTVKREYREKFNLAILKQAGFNNTYTLATTPEIARRHGLDSISDLKEEASDLTAAVGFEFINRQDGLPGLSEHYGFEFAQANAMNGAQKYVALENGNVHFIDAFATDGLLKKFNLVVLEDDQNFFPPYYAMPVMRAEIAEKHAELIPLVESLGDILTNEVMMELNYRVDELRQDPQVVAADFLREQGLIE